MFTLKMAKAGFFDRAAVISRVDAATRKVLSKFGAFVRTRAKRSIRKRKRTSRPGEAPTSRTGLLRDYLFFAYDHHRASVVIGPAKLNRVLDGTAPHTLEYGGAVSLPRRGGGSIKVSILARPFMGPAYEAERPKLPQVWRDSVR